MPSALIELLRGSVTFTPARSGIGSAALLGLALVACGGKQELNFVGLGGGDGGGGGNPVSATCGDRKVDTDEQCDDGDRADDDGCSGSCEVEEGWTCSGEPSACVKCGNGTVEEAEECDDGNADDGDGCGTACTIEGTCAAPVAVELTADADGLAGSVTSFTSRGEAEQVPAADCGGADVGGGSDRVFEFELPRPADLRVRVGANFDAVVRLTTTPCELTEVDSCADEGAVSEEETIAIDNAAPGKYYVIVDGKTPQQAGSFSVNVEARCPLDGLKIDRVILGEPFRTVLLNTNPSCSIDLSRVGVYAQPEAADGPRTLPAIELEPLARRVLTSESPPPTGLTYQGNIRYDLDDYAGTFYLCRGECDTARGSNVFDAFRWDGAAEPSSPPLSAVSFDASAPGLSDRVRLSYFRVGYDGVAPDFTADDWVGAYFAEGFEDGALSGWDAPTELFYDASFEPVAGTSGAFSLQLDGGNPAVNVWNGPKVRFRDNAGAIMALRPSYVSLRVRGSNKMLNHGSVFFGNPGSAGNLNAEAKGFGSFFRETGSLCFANPTVAFVLPYQVNTWYEIEYQDFDWAARTANVFVNGTNRGALPLGADSVSQLSIRNLSETSAWIDRIIVQ